MATETIKVMFLIDVLIYMSSIILSYNVAYVVIHSPDVTRYNAIMLWTVALFTTIR